MFKNIFINVYLVDVKQETGCLLWIKALTQQRKDIK